MHVVHYVLDRVLMASGAGHGNMTRSLHPRFGRGRGLPFGGDGLLTKVRWMFDVAILSPGPLKGRDL